VQIRAYRPDDLAAVLALNNASVPDVNELDEPEVARLVALADAALVAEVDGGFAGFCWVLGPGRPYASLNYTWFSARYDDFVYLDRIAVHPHYRRYGVGSALYAELASMFTGRRPVLLCEVNLRPRNETSLRFHERVGFREVGQQDTDGGAKRVSLLAWALEEDRAGQLGG
jgi:predicted GNAT superfamily acetyltransferase